MLARLKFPACALAALLLASSGARPAYARGVACNNKFCGTDGSCHLQSGGPKSWCFEEGGACSWDTCAVS